MASIQTLPIELVENIAYRLPLPAFSAFRRSCRDLNLKSQYSFEQRFFKTRTIKLTWGSLQNLLSILNTEKYRRVLEHLIVKCEVLVGFPDWRSGRSGVDVAQLPGYNQAHTRELRRRSVDHTQTRCAAGVVKNSLICAMRKIPRLGSLRLQYVEYDPSDTKKRPNPFFNAPTHRYGADFRITAATSGFSTVMAAVSSAQLLVENLSVYDDEWGGNVALSAFDIPEYQSNLYREALQNLKCLRLRLTTRHKNWDSDAPTLALPGRLFTILPALEELDLGMSIDYHTNPPRELSIPMNTRDVLAAIAKGARFSKLKKFRLSRVCVSDAVLRALLSTTQHLADLELRDVWVDRHGIKGLSEFLADELRADRLHIKNLRSGDSVVLVEELDLELVMGQERRVLNWNDDG